MSDHRIGIGSIFTESNHLVGTRRVLEDFQRTEFRRGSEILQASEGVVGGILSVLSERATRISPTLVASAYPGGLLTEDCYATLKEELLQRLKDALPVDGFIAPLHGGAAVERIGDLEGNLLEAIRSLIGPDVPLVATLDCHAHVSEAMVRNANALVAWETYPHHDTFETGERGARLLCDILDRRVRPAMAMAKVPLIVGGFCGGTEPPSPFAEIMRLARSKEGQNSIISTSAFLVQPHLDLADMGGGALVVTDGDIETATREAAEVAELYWKRREAFEPEMWTPTAAVARGVEVGGASHLLLEVSDCVGGGAAGDAVSALGALLEAQLPEPSLAMVVDPQAQAACRAAGIGNEVELKLGYGLDPRWGSPLEVRGEVEKLSDGSFVYSGGIWGGEEGNMGPSARLRIGSVEVLVSTYGTYDWSDEQYHSMGMDTSSAKFVVVKNPMNFRVGYAGRYGQAFVLDTPGPTTANLAEVDFRELERPFFPKDRDIPGLVPTIYQHVS